MNKSFVIAGLRRVLYVYIGILVVLYFIQRSLLYYPHKDLAAPDTYGLSEMEIVELISTDNLKLTAWYKAPSKDNYPTMIYYHGNAGHLGFRATKYRSFINEGFGLLALSYRGFGTSEGKPSEDGFYDDARTAIKFLQNKGLKEEDIIFYGESLGTGVAVQMSLEFKAKALILEAPYTSIVEVAQEIYWLLPVKWIIKDEFNTIDKIADIGIPVLILHGEDDEIIPIEQAKKLFAAAKEPKKAVYFPNHSHNDDNTSETVHIIIDFIGI